MNEQQALGWLGRKIGWGFAPGQWAEWEALGVDGVIDRLVDPDAHDVPARLDPFAAIEIDPENAQRALRVGVGAWIENLIASPRPLESYMEFFWSDYFAVSARSVRPTYLMFDHMNLLGRHGLGNFAELLTDITTDAAMLVFLDGASSSAGNPNENFGRELLELYSVGVGNFTEDDVKAAATALTGWQVRRRNPVPRYQSNRHDDTPQTLLGVDGVHDVDTVIAAVVADPATPRRVVNKLATAVLGPDHDEALVAPLADSFADDLEIRPVMRALLELGVEGAATPAIVEPLAWLTTAVRFTGTLPRQGVLRDYFRTSGQVPMFPPNVGGFPEPTAYLSTSATIARFNLSSELATSARAQAVDATADVDELAHTLGLVDGFTAASRDAIGALPAGTGRIAASLASPDLLVA